jgi:hypothetical protein
LDTRHKTKTIQRHWQHRTQDTRRRQSRDTDNIGHKTQDTRQSRDTGNIGHKTKKIQRHWQHWTQDTRQRQSSDTGNIGYKTQDKDNQETLATSDTRHKSMAYKTRRHNKTQTN